MDTRQSLHGVASDNNNLPDGWAIAKLQDIADIIMGQSPPGSTYNDEGEGLPFFQGKAEFSDRYPNVRVWCTSPKKIAEAGDVLISVRAPVGPTNVANTTCAIGRGLAAIRPLGKISTEYVLFVLRLLEPQIAAGGVGSTFTAIKKADLEEIEIPVAPLAEQKRIVAKVEELLARVNATRERLAKVPAILKRFRQAVLAAACSGRLTEDWRGDGGATESAAELLARINLDREQEYERACKGAKRNNRRPPLRQLYVPSIEPSNEALPKLPNGWIWTKVSMLGACGEEVVKTGPFGAILKSKEFVTEGVPIIAVGNVQWGYLDLQNARVDHVTEEKASQLSDYRVQVGDVLFTRSGSIGRSLVVPPAAGEWLMSYHLLRVRPDHRLIEPKFLYFVFSGCEASKDYTIDSIVGTTRPGINTTILENLPVPLAPYPEQFEIVRRVEALFKLADIIENRVGTGRRIAERLTQAILGKAFRGELVPTEAELARREGRSYDSASELLARIKEDRGSFVDSGLTRIRYSARA
ncbi:MAG: restriction endonuclease subunit S [Deltaproteobacteria bacterium]|nr:restriction endonuclease subunit S [Deltaproteobacteria bacterium]